MSNAVRAQLHDAMRRGYVAALRLLGSPEQAHDACQEAAARALSAGDRYDPAQPFYPWFYRILKNHCLDRLRHRKRMLARDEPGRELAAPDRSAEQTMLAGERAQAVERAIAALPEELREIIELRHFQEASYEEIALALDIPNGTVMSRLYRARHALRAKLRSEGSLARGDVR
jgi:RNA polymerase sigma-70 factor, ECF subfamily